MPRRLGPDCPCNTLALCGGCHTRHVHGHPVWARSNGWIVSSAAGLPPADVPAWLHGRWMLLACDGTIQPMRDALQVGLADPHPGPVQSAMPGPAEGPTPRRNP